MEPVELISVSGEFVPDTTIGFSEALKLLPVSKSTFYRDIKTGKVAYEAGENGVRRYRLSTLEAVYGSLSHETNSPGTADSGGSLALVCLMGLLAQQAVYQQQQIDLLTEYLSREKPVLPWWKKVLRLNH